MNNFSIQTNTGIVIRFRLYLQEAPVTCQAFYDILPFTGTFFHARVSGEEVWTDRAPELHIIQENASVFTLPGEVVLGPMNPKRNKTSGAMGIYYGEGKGLDACNIFARVFEEDLVLLADLGNQIWKEGALSISFKAMD